MLSRADVLAFRDRDWARLRAEKRAYWRRRMSRGGMAEALRVTELLRSEMSARDPSWPTKAQREEDLQTHIRVAKALAATASPTHRRTRSVR